MAPINSRRERKNAEAGGTKKDQTDLMLGNSFHSSRRLYNKHGCCIYAYLKVKVKYSEYKKGAGKGFPNLFGSGYENPAVD